MNASDLLQSAFSGALVVISGGLYALFLALARLRASRLLGHLSVAAYVALVVSAFALANGLDLSPSWYVVVAAMLVGYWLAPKAIWHLTVATHAPESRQ